MPNTEWTTMVADLAEAVCAQIRAAEEHGKFVKIEMKTLEEIVPVGDGLSQALPAGIQYVITIKDAREA